MAVLVFINLMSCASTTTIPRSEYTGIDEHEQQDYRVHLKDGMEYYANRITVDDSMLTIFDLNATGKTRSQAQIYGRLPYSVDLDHVHSIVIRKDSSLIIYTYIGLMVAVVAFALFAYSIDYGSMPN
jgi:hypothetical protein